MVVNQDGAVQLYALRHPQVQSFLAVAAIEACKPIRSLGRKGVDILKLRIATLRKWHARHACVHRQITCGRVKSAVDKNEAVSVQSRHRIRFASRSGNSLHLRGQDVLPPGR